MIKWLAKNWFKILIALVFIIGLILLDRACHDSAAQKKIDANNKEISDLKGKNEKLEIIALESTEKAKEWQKRAKEKEELIIVRDLEIKELKEEQKKVTAVVMELPASELVAGAREILDCAEIELQDNGILFSEFCARKALIDLREFSLVKRQVGLIEQSMIDCQDGWTFQKLATWNIYRTAWAQGMQILNYKTIVKNQDENFSLLKKQKKGAWLNGAWKGFLAGLIVAAVIKLLRIL